MNKQDLMNHRIRLRNRDWNEARASASVARANPRPISNGDSLGDSTHAHAQQTAMQAHQLPTRVKPQTSTFTESLSTLKRTPEKARRVSQAP